MFAGTALSGTMSSGDTPRAGIDLAYSLGSDVDLKFAQGGIAGTSDLSLGSVSGVRAFGEYGFKDLIPSEDSTLSFTPRAFCNQRIESDDISCGIGATLDFTTTEDSDGVSSGLKFNIERTSVHSYMSIEASQSINLGSLKLSGLAKVSENGFVSIGADYRTKLGSMQLNGSATASENGEVSVIQEFNF